MTLYTQVSRNREKTWFFLMFYVVLILGIGYFASWYFGSSLIFVLAALLSIGQGIASFWFSDSIALASSHAEELDKGQYDRVYKIVENLTITAGLPMPRLFLIPDMAMNAFATGRDAKHAAIAVTKGLVDKLDDNELAGVLGHELSHIGNEDIRLMSMVMVMAGLIALISNWVLRSMFWGGGRRGGNNGGEGGVIMLLIGIALAVLAPIAAMLIQLAISRKREFMADANSVLLTRYPEGMISALQKIGGDTEPTVEANKATAHMYFSNPLNGGGLSKLFTTHPPIEDRIAALRKGSGLLG